MTDREEKPLIDTSYLTGCLLPLVLLAIAVLRR